MTEVFIERLHHDARVPDRATVGSAGYDLYSLDVVTLKPGERRLFKLGFRMELPDGYEAQVRPRSGLALKRGLTVLNAPGTIDSDYRGEVGVILVNTDTAPQRVAFHEAIAQLVFAKVESADLLETDVEVDTDRGEGGFGSTDE